MTQEIVKAPLEGVVIVPTCDVCWSSHGCMLEQGHPPGKHVCGYSEDDIDSTIELQDDGTWIRTDHWEDGTTETVGYIVPFHARSDAPVY